MPYDPAWRIEDERRQKWLERCYQNDGRRNKDHPMHSLYTGLIQKWGKLPWPVK